MTTVAVCTYERGPLRNLDALAGLDVLVLDASGSLARRALVAREASARGFRRVETPGAPLAAQRNAALREARDERLVFLDDDCLPRAGWLDALERALDEADVATARVVTPPSLRGEHSTFFDQDHGASSRDFGRERLRIFPARPLAAYAAESSIAPWAVGTGSCFAVRVGAARRVGGFREDFGVGSPARSGEDVEFFYRAIRDGLRVRYEADAVVEHHHARRSEQDYLRTAFDYAWGGRAFVRLAMRDRVAYAAVLLGRPVQLALIAARYAVRGDRATARMCHAAIRGWLGLPPPTARAPRRWGASARRA